MVDPVGSTKNNSSPAGGPNFADVARAPQTIAQVSPPLGGAQPSGLDVGLCRAGKVGQGVAGAAETAGGVVIGMGGTVVTILGVAVATLETPFMGIAGKQPFWGTAVAGAGVSGLGVGLSLGADGLNRIGAQFSAPSCSAPR